VGLDLHPYGSRQGTIEQMGCVRLEEVCICGEEKACIHGLVLGRLSIRETNIIATRASLVETRISYHLKAIRP